MKELRPMWQNAKKTVLKNFKTATTTFLLIMLVVYGFQILFGKENMVLGIIIAPMMLVLMMRDMTAHPVKHFFRQALVLCGMAAAACFSAVLPFSIALLIHLSVVFILLYTYTCEYGDHIYFQYILNYLFLIFMGPISLRQLPLRLLGMVAGAGCLLLYQCFKRRDRGAAVTRDVLLALLEDTENQINSLIHDEDPPHSRAKLSRALKAFSQKMEHRRKASLGLSDAGMAAVETVLSLEKLNFVLRSPDFAPTQRQLVLLQSIFPWMHQLRAFIMQEQDNIPQIHREFLGNESDDADYLYEWMVHLRQAFLNMPCPEMSQSFCKTSITLKERLKIAINFSPVRFAYALRLAVLLTAGILLVQNFNLGHGKWLLFTIVSISQPYADEVWPKAKKRFFATLIGGVAGLIVFSLIPSSTGRMAAVMFSGYLSCYMTDYLSNFSCATFGALGGAVMAGAVGGVPVGSMVIMRIAYVVIGIIIAIVFNCFLIPISQRKATRHLAQKYTQVTQRVYEGYRNCQMDPQLYYHLVLKMHRLEDKLRQNAKTLHWEGVNSFLLSRQIEVWKEREISA